MFPVAGVGVPFLGGHADTGHLVTGQAKGRYERHQCNNSVPALVPADGIQIQLTETEQPAERTPWLYGEYPADAKKDEDSNSESFCELDQKANMTSSGTCCFLRSVGMRNWPLGPLLNSPAGAVLAKDEVRGLRFQERCSIGFILS